MHPFYVVTTYQIVLNQYEQKKNEHEWLLKAVILKTESTFPLFYPFSISNGDIKKFFFNRNFVNSLKHFMRDLKKKLMLEAEWLYFSEF